MEKEKWLMVEFNCSNGWDKVITSIPESEKSNAVKYLEDQEGYCNITNLKIEPPLLHIK